MQYITWKEEYRLGKKFASHISVMLVKYELELIQDKH